LVKNIVKIITLVPDRRRLRARLPAGSSGRARCCRDRRHRSRKLCRRQSRARSGVDLIKQFRLRLVDKTLKGLHKWQVGKYRFRQLFSASTSKVLIHHCQANTGLYFFEWYWIPLSKFWIVIFLLPIFSKSTAPWLGTENRTDVAFCFVPGAGHHYHSGAGCTGTPFLEFNFIHVNALLGCRGPFLTLPLAPRG
jgi:hypothetical protein